MEENFNNPNYVPEEYKIPFDVVEVPSQGILYPDGKGTFRVEYLTTYDENILGSPNLSNNGNTFNILLKRKIKDIAFDPLDLLEGDRMAILIFLRASGLGEIYQQPVIDPSSGKVVIGEIDLTKLGQKKLTVKPDENGEFDFQSESGKKYKFKLLTGRDYQYIEERDKSLMERMPEEERVSQEITLTLERQIKEIDGERDPMKLSRIISILPPMESRQIRNYINSIEPGINLKCNATIPGGGSVSTFLRFGKNFL